MKYLVPDIESPVDHKGQQHSETKSISHEKHKAGKKNRQITICKTLDSPSMLPYFLTFQEKDNK